MRTTLLSTIGLPIQTTSAPGCPNPKNKMILQQSPSLSTPSIGMASVGTSYMCGGRKRYGE